MKTHFFLTTLFALTGLSINAQTTFQKIYGGTSNITGYIGQPTNDGSFIIAGTTSSFGAGSSDFYLMKTSSEGTLQWTKTFGGTGDEVASSIQQTSDGGFILSGYTYGGFGAGVYDAYLVKTSSDGTLQWSKTFGATHNDYGYNVKQTNDGGYIITGWTDSFSGTLKFYLVRTDFNGSLQWVKTFGGNMGEQATSVFQTSDG